jgi:hypothetical protein
MVNKTEFINKLVNRLRHLLENEIKSNELPLSEMVEEAEKILFRELKK